MIKWKRISRQVAATNLEKYFREGQFETNIDVYPDYKALANSLRQAYDEAVHNITDGNDKYHIDVEFGLRLYKILNSYPYSMKLREAGDDGIWRFLSVEVVPDIIYRRWAKSADELPLDHYYKKVSRNYLKSIWWYIHLSYQQDDESTRAVLANNSTDTIVALVERTGKSGYSVDLYREILRAFANPVADYIANDRQLFRKIMVLNTAWTATIEPALFMGGIPGYVKELYSHFSKKETA